ncbi:biosynthetic peptidoglycan transglycosylase [Halobacteriovorax sp. HLS]|uniref:biosynthetic peptidoglycan transglycosylase n=1 Tax=Halobacteriovorax sp. HLS TaxID=2234000 RepID=UPI000FDA9832|nr:biosynthetic peptidoglycan transglycosylase [Halobacteriovorax sp. HLS]
MKKRILLPLLSIFVLLIIVALYIFKIPFGDIGKLEKQYVKVELTKDKKSPVEYSIVEKMPKGWVQLKDISPHAVKAIMLSEDWFFYGHDGVDLSQVKEAALDGIKGEKLRGASTISQQVTKNLFLSNDRTVQRKFRELLITLYLEKKVSKDKILEIYLNIIQYGKSLYGIKAASKKYFKKSPKNLNAYEGAFLAMLLPSPVRYGQSYKDRKLTKFAKETMDNIIDKMVLAKVLTKEEGAREKKRRLSFTRSKSKVKGLGNMQKIKSHDDGRNWEKRYEYDPDLAVKEDFKYDPDAINEDDLNVKEEFTVE